MNVMANTAVSGIHHDRREHHHRLLVRGCESALAAMLPARASLHSGPARAGLFHQEPNMQIIIKGHQVDITPALHDYATAKFERITRHFDQLHDLNIVLGIEKLLHKAEATIQLSGKKLHADATAADMYAAIDALVDKMDNQVRKHKEKVTAHHADSVRATRYG
jgi:putative sigma-54 modulation protein